MNHVLNTKVKGSALYIAIIISVVIGVLLSMMLLISRYSKLQVTKFEQFSQLVLDLNSGFELAGSDFFGSAYNNKWIKNTYNDDSIKVCLSQWGAYRLINVIAKNRNEQVSGTGLYGVFASSDTGLVVNENNRQIGVCGNIKFKGNCYLPSAGIKPIYIDGASTRITDENNAHIKTVKSELQVLSDHFMNGIKLAKEEARIGTDSFLLFLPQKINQSFSKKTITIIVPGNDLKNVAFENNIKIIGQNELIIDYSSHLENVLIVCRKVRFRSGFNGTVHVISTDSIIIEKDCVFNYPSSFVLNPGPNGVRGAIVFKDACDFSGAIIAFQNTTSSNSNVMVKLNKDCTIAGLIYSSGYLQAQGLINGTMLCRNLLVESNSSIYENAIYNCEIDPARYAGVLVVPGLFNERSELICCKKFND